MEFRRSTNGHADDFSVKDGSEIIIKERSDESNKKALILLNIKAFCIS